MENVKHYNRIHTLLMDAVLASRTAHRMIGYWYHTVVCPYVCLSVMLCIVAKRYIMYGKSD